VGLVQIKSQANRPVDLDGVVDLQPNSQARDTFIVDQHSDPTLARAWDLAKEQKGGFFIKNGILFHRDLCWGYQLIKCVCPMVVV